MATFFKLFCFVTLAIATVTAVPSKQAHRMLKKRAAPGQPDIDMIILNYALTLEHLEAAFYRDCLPSKEAFVKEGFTEADHDRFIEIGGHEASHVEFLTKALGDKAVKECKYEFGVTDAKSFVATAQLLEGVGVSAYLGAAANITNTDYLVAAGSILTTEARHSAWVQSGPEKSDFAGSAYDTPLNFNETYSLAAPLIKSCPETNAKLPVKAFPPAKFKTPPTALGQEVEIERQAIKPGDKVAFLSGGTGPPIFANFINGNSKVKLPEGVKWGRSYAIVVTGDATKVTDDNTVAGPIPFDILPTPQQAAMKYGTKKSGTVGPTTKTGSVNPPTKSGGKRHAKPPMPIA